MDTTVKNTKAMLKTFDELIVRLYKYNKAFLGNMNQSDEAKTMLCYNVLALDKFGYDLLAHTTIKLAKYHITMKGTADPRAKVVTEKYGNLLQEILKMLKVSNLILKILLFTNTKAGQVLEQKNVVKNDGIQVTRKREVRGKNESREARNTVKFNVDPDGPKPQPVLTAPPKATKIESCEKFEECMKDSLGGILPPSLVIRGANNYEREQYLISLLNDSFRNAQEAGTHQTQIVTTNRRTFVNKLTRGFLNVMLFLTFMLWLALYGRDVWNFYYYYVHQEFQYWWFVKATQCSSIISLPLSLCYHIHNYYFQYLIDDTGHTGDGDTFFPH